MLFITLKYYLLLHSSKQKQENKTAFLIKFVYYLLGVIGFD
jgi:hypothetical protein